MNREGQGVFEEPSLAALFEGEIVEVELFLTSRQIRRLESLAQRHGATLARYLRHLLEKGICEASEEPRMIPWDETGTSMQ